MIFISYSREDRDCAERIAARLRAAGKTILRDPTALQGDPFWRRSVRELIGSSDTMLVLWSRYAAQSPWVDQEVRAFREKAEAICLDDTPLPDGWLGRYETASPEHGSEEKEAGENIAKQRAEFIRSEEVVLARFRKEVRGRARPVVAGADGACRTADGSRLIRIGEDVYLAATPVTNEQYRVFTEAAGYQGPPTWDEAAFRERDAPVVGVTWFEAMAYAAWIGADLPSREEWRFAASAGKARREYATADGRLSPEAANYGAAFGGGAPCANSAYDPNPLGFYGLSGNSWDWCSTAEGAHRAICGGGYMDSPDFCRVTATYRNAPIDRDCCVGFRVRVTVDSSGGTK